MDSSYAEHRYKVLELINQIYKKIEREIPDKKWLEFHKTYQRRCEGIYDKILYEYRPKLDNILGQYLRNTIDEIKSVLDMMFKEIIPLWR